MAFASDKGRQGAAGQGGAVTSYDIDNSLRLNDDDSAYLSKTPTTAGNRKTWTLSLWFKRGNLGSYWNVFGTDSEGECIRISTSDQIEFFHNGAASSYLKTSQVFRDPSAWYHVIWANDTTQSTPSDRVKIYINGEQVTAWASEAYPDEDSVFKVNQISQTHYLGNGHAPASSREFDGYLAEVNFIDGVPTGYTESEWQALDHSTLFGEFDATYGHWKPIAYDGTYGTNGFYLPMGDSSLVSASALEPDGTTVIAPVTDGNYKYHIFTEVGDSTFTVDSASTGSQVEYLVIAGGGGGGGNSGATGGGGGGAGGYRTGYLSVSAQSYTITVGDGGNAESAGSSSIFSTITSAGGGLGAYSNTAGGGGGSGGGGTRNGGCTAGGAATPSGQGNAGSAGCASGGDGNGGGGGAGDVGTGGTSGVYGGPGGVGLASSITGSSVFRAGGGGGGGYDSDAGGTGGNGGGGNGANGMASAGAVGTPNTGGGGGGGGDAGSSAGTVGGAGGSGVVIIRYKYQG